MKQKIANRKGLPNKKWTQSISSGSSDKSETAENEGSECSNRKACAIIRTRKGTNIPKERGIM